MILVAGATGYLGREICRRLRAENRAVRALVRATSDADAIAELDSLGVEKAVGDLREPESLAAACRDVETVVSTVTTTRSRQPGESIESTDRDGQIALVDAAASAGVKRFVYVSYSGNIGVDDPLTLAKRAIEDRVRGSGMTYTILRPSCFMEAWLSPAFGFDAANRKATIYGSGEKPMSWVSLFDVAEFAVRAVDDPQAANATIEIGGPEALSPNDVVSLFEEETGEKFEVQHVPEEALAAQQAAATDSLQKSFAALMLACAKGDPIPMDETLRRFPIQLTSVREYARRTAGNRSGR